MAAKGAAGAAILHGDDTASSTTYAQALEHALRNEVMIYSIIDVPIEVERAAADLGGLHGLISRWRNNRRQELLCKRWRFAQKFARVSEYLRTQYRGGYLHHQTPGTSFHRIQVTVPRAAGQAFNRSPQDAPRLAGERQLRLLEFGRPL